MNVPPAQPGFVPMRRYRLGLAVVVSLAAATLTLWGSFLPQYFFEITEDDSTVSVDFTSWSFDVSPASVDVTALGDPISGLPLAIATVLLMIAACVSGTGAIPGVPLGVGRAAGMFSIAAAAFLTATVLMAVLEVVGYHSNIEFVVREAKLDSREGTYFYGTGAGLWLLAAAVVLALAAVVLTLMSLRPRRVTGAALATPPLGFPAPPTVSATGVHQGQTSGATSG